MTWSGEVSSFHQARLGLGSWTYPYLRILMALTMVATEYISMAMLGTAWLQDSMVQPNMAIRST